MPRTGSPSTVFLVCGTKSLILPPPCSLPPLAQSQNRQVAATPLPPGTQYIRVTAQEQADIEHVSDNFALNFSALFYELS
ncbi:unnamed protein product [Clavelina lepadiformis]|uniref:Uncharacterized protein n=1 Tax=Clavelina lepadiformis TaxID=159417 RepID=A0ABP0FMK4_CLALP